MFYRSPYPKTFAAALVAVLVGCDSEVKPGQALPDFVMATSLIHTDALVERDFWNVTRAGGTAPVDATVCIIDSGVDLTHPDLNVSVTLSRSFLDHGPEKNDPNDYNGHGTHVAGIIGALDNDHGVTGIASGATIVALKVVDRKGRGYTEDVLEAIRYVGHRSKTGERLCDVVNFSIGAAQSPEVDKAVLKAAQSVPFVLSAGNKGKHVKAFSPAGVNGKQIYTVTALAREDRWPVFSNFGQGVVDYAAPGVFVHSTWKNGGYKTISGTSAAAAHVSGMLLRGGMQPDGIVMDMRGGAYTIPRVLDPELAPMVASAASPQKGN
jgi:subtilisin family serine protease